MVHVRDKQQYVPASSVAWLKAVPSAMADGLTGGRSRRRVQSANDLDSARDEAGGVGLIVDNSIIES
jgi:hypothetical protein